MAENKTRPTPGSAADFLAAVQPAAKRDDAQTLCRMMADVSGAPPVMWGPSIIGFGRYHYRYESGREGDAPRIGFSPRASALVLYIMDGFPQHAALTARLGKHSSGKACLYVKKLAEVDQQVLRELIGASLAHMQQLYPDD